jgi:LemA protein
MASTGVGIVSSNIHLLMRSLLPYLLILGILLIVVISIYNGLVVKRNQVRNAFSSIDVNLRKRHDLIPALVETVKGFATHEQETLTRLVEARNQIHDTNLSESERLRVEETIGPGMQHLVALAEGYPELRSNTQFLHLQRNLTEIEEQISAARRAYNAAVFEINTAVESFPSNILASAFGFERHHFFEAAADARDNVNVKFS